MEDTFDYNLFYSEYKTKSLLFAKSYLHDDLIVEDVVSDTFMKLWEISKEKLVETPEFLLFRILKNKCLDVLRHNQMKREKLSNISDIDTRELDLRIQTLEASDPNNIFAGDIQKIINQTLLLLPEQTRTVFQKYRIEGVDKKEVAELFNISIKGVDYHVSKAVNLFRQTLKDYLPLLFTVILHFF